MLVPAAVCVGANPSALADQYDAPASYYNSATGTGATLSNQLFSIISSGHLQRSYGDFRNSAILHDADPDNPGNILLVYNRASVSGTWNSGVTWNREHVWPVSRQPGSSSNSTRGNIGDPHALRPSNPQINSNRANLPFGNANSTGSHGFAAGGYYFPGDADKGDIARSLFYSDTRYGPVNGINLVNGQPGANQMGDLASLVAWHFLDVPDTFERRRNHVIYSQAENPFYYTNNRSPYVDRPEFVWSVFVDQNNDTKLLIDGAAVNADGSSLLDLAFSNVIVGASLPAAQAVMINKSGNDGTYYSVSSDSASLVVDREGRYNAFAMGGSAQQALSLQLQGSTATPGTIGGTVTVDNLDVTSGAGLGMAAQDGDDVIYASLTVFDHANPSFKQLVDIDTQALDLGDFVINGVNGPAGTQRIFNKASVFGADLTAGLDLDSINETDLDGKFQIDGSLFSNVQANGSRVMTVTGVADALGTFNATYQFALSDEDLSGEASHQITLDVTFDVVGLLGDMNGDGALTNGDISAFVQALTDPAGFAGDFPEIDPNLFGDFTGDGQFTNGDIAGFVAALTQGTAVPEPSALLMMVVGGWFAARRPRG